MPDAAPEGALTRALLEVQKAAPALQRDSINPHFQSSYLSLERLMEQVLPVLNEHGLVWITRPTFELNGAEMIPTLAYELRHEGGSISGAMPLLLAKRDPQGQGSAITYARRYALMAVLGLVADADDDGNAGSSAPAARRTAPKRTRQPKAPAGAKADALAAIKDFIRTERPEEAQVRLALASVGVDADGTVAAAIKGLTEDQGRLLLAALTDTNKES